KVRHEERILRGDTPFQKVIEYVILCRKTSKYVPPKIKEKEEISEYIYRIEELDKPFKIENIRGYEVHIFKPHQYRIKKLPPSKNNLKRYTIRGSLITQKGSASEYYEKYLRRRKEVDGLGCLYKVIGMGVKGDGLGYRYIQQPASPKVKNGIYFQGYPLQEKQGKPIPNFLDFIDEFNKVAGEGAVLFKNGKKPVKFVKQLIMLGKGEKISIILDFFAGSGTTAHAVMKLNKEDGGRRKFILVEMADYFDTVIIPRIKKVAYSFNWKDGRPQDTDGIGVFFKYQYLEQYEDTLNNIIFAGEEGRQVKLLEFEDYIFHILDYGTRSSVSRLNIDKFKKPFEYKMEILENGIPKKANVDLIETFNYLLGLHVKKIHTENANGRKYIWVIGERKDKSLVVVIWRNSEELDLVQDKKYIESKLSEIADDAEPDYIYVNGDSYVQNAIPIEMEFMKLVGA
ncbi:hypothetical protein DRN58_07825, partial [Thermococci archaeon]